MHSIDTSLTNGLNIYELTKELDKNEEEITFDNKF